MPRTHSDIEQRRAIKEVLVQMFEILLCAGYSEEAIRAHAVTCIDEAKQQIHLAPLIAQDIDAQEIGSVIRTWHRSHAYLSSDGSPRPLSLGGADGLRMLVRRFFPANQVERIVETMKDTGLIRRRKDNKWVPAREQAVIPHLTTEMLGHLAEGVSRFVETVIGNVTADQEDEFLFERSAKVSKFPARDTPAFRKFLKAQAISFLSAVDDWMEARAELNKSKAGKKCTVGVFTFGFMDDWRRRKKTRKGATRARVHESL